ncbi:MAG: kelch repeat-containing protein [Thermoplasmata archaeon]|nr:kelch repeat-containing protein [Thermoplasmata archaeon]
MEEGDRGSGVGSELGGAAVLFALILLLVSGLVPAAGGAARPRSLDPVSTAPAHLGRGVASAALASAGASLAVGGGPAYGVPWSCQSTAGGAGCAASNGGAARSVNVLSAPTWSAVEFAPSAREIQGGTTMAFDTADAYVVLFGGSNVSGALGDTWTFAGSVWTHLHPKSAPSARYGDAMAYDNATKSVLLFGGYDGVSTSFSDTWSFAKGQWTKLTPVTSPPKLVYANAAYDANDSYLLLFGGVVGPAFTVTSQATFTYAGGNWHKLAPATSPPGRYGGAMAYDAVDGWVVLFGGFNDTRASSLGDTWNFSAGHWTNRTSSLAIAPKARNLGAMAYDATDRALLLFGGRTNTNAPLGDTWSFVHGAWSRPTPAFAPSARFAPGLSAISSTGGVVLFGGGGVSGVLGDAWSYGAGVWHHVLPAHPAPRVAAAVTYDEADGYVLLFGGIDNARAYNDTWSFSAGAWHHLHPARAPSPRIGAAMAYDGADGYVVLFGGENVFGTLFNDTWTFLAGVWSPLPPPTLTKDGFLLPAMALSSLAYDAADGYLLMFGGSNLSGLTRISLNGTFEFSGGFWTPATPVRSPPGRDAAGMAYDSWDGEVVLFGGENLSSPSTTVRNDTWVWAAGSWTYVATPVAPSQRAAPVMTYDETDGYLLLFGGVNDTVVSTVYGDTWSFLGGVWTQLTPSLSPPADFFGAGAFDAKMSTVVLVPGSTNNIPPYRLLTGVWTY